jgi:hypothetical protein
MPFFVFLKQLFVWIWLTKISEFQSYFDNAQFICSNSDVYFSHSFTTYEFKRVYELGIGPIAVTSHF